MLYFIENITCNMKILVNPWADHDDEQNSDRMSLNDGVPTLLPMVKNNCHYYDPYFIF